MTGIPTNLDLNSLHADHSGLIHAFKDLASASPEDKSMAFTKLIFAMQKAKKKGAANVGTV